jgi:hypothetical protein
MPARNGKTLKRKSEAATTTQQEPHTKKQATSTEAPATETTVEKTNGSNGTMAEEIPQRFETLQLHAGYVNFSLTSVVGAPCVAAWASIIYFVHDDICGVE